MKQIINIIMEWYKNCFDEHWYMEGIPFILLASSSLILLVVICSITGWWWFLLIPIITILYLYYKWK